MSCRSDLSFPVRTAITASCGSADARPLYVWTDITWLLHKHRVGWALLRRRAPARLLCDAASCKPIRRTQQDALHLEPAARASTRSQQDRQLGNVQSNANYSRRRRTGTLPAVSWVMPTGQDSEHPPDDIARRSGVRDRRRQRGHARARLEHTAIFLTWDDWGGFYDHVAPPKVDKNGYGCGCPGWSSARTRRPGYIDHQILSFDAYLKFIEDASSTERDRTRRPTAGPTAADGPRGRSVLGDLVQDFDFDQQPLDPLYLGSLALR